MNEKAEKRGNREPRAKAKERGEGEGGKRRK